METNGKYRNLLSRIPAVVCELDPDGNTLFVNPAVAGVLGYSPDELVGRNWFDIFYPGEARGQVDEFMPRLREGDLADYRVRMTARDGSVKVVSWNTANQYNLDGTLASVIGFGVDRTEHEQADRERARLEKQVYFSGRMESLGRLAGGMAHDFNNLLAVIISYADLVGSELPEGDVLREDVQEISEAGRRAAELTQQLLLFSRREVILPEVMDLNDAVTGLTKLLRRTIGENIKLTTSLDPAPAQVKADPGKIELMLVNLAVRARDAMPQGGGLTIETANVNVDEAAAREHVGLEPGPRVRLTVSDTGKGMTEEEAAHVFEPVFSARQRGPHIDMGLATVYGIVRQAGGTIWVDTTADTGSAFVILLPAVKGRAVRKSGSSGTQPAVGGGQTVLVVEDEGALRALICRVLTRNGYEVLQAPDGREGFAVAQGHDGKIDLLLTDVVMPGISGKELADRLREVRPGIRVLYVSGYTDDAMLDQGVLDENVVLLKKPFTPRQLAARVGEVLAEPSPCT